MPEIEIDYLIQTLQEVRKKFPTQQITVHAYEGEVQGIVIDVDGRELGYIPNGDSTAKLIR